MPRRPDAHPSSAGSFLSVGFATSNLQGWGNVSLWDKKQACLLFAIKQQNPQAWVPLLNTTCCRCRHPPGPVCTAPRELGLGEPIRQADALLTAFESNEVFQNCLRSLCLLGAPMKRWRVDKTAWMLGDLQAPRGRRWRSLIWDQGAHGHKDSGHSRYRQLDFQKENYIFQR